MSTATLLLPARLRLAAQPLPAASARALGRADASVVGEAGERAQLLRHFDLLPRGWPVAALTRSQDANDAASAQWLRADPAWVRPDINGARLFACGDGLHLSREDADALLPALRTLFGDAGFPIDAPTPSRWYLRMPVGAKPPAFPGPDEALGTDLFDALVGTDGGTDAGLRRWRALLNEAQVALHNHPWNARRAAAGKPPVNSLWFWGGGMLPDHVSTVYMQVASDDVPLRALAANAGLVPLASGSGFGPVAGDALFDLREARDLAALDRDWLQPALDALRRGGLLRLRLDFADGTGCVLVPAQRWRFWRRPLARLATVPRDDMEA
jgi:hypothetical protein